MTPQELKNSILQQAIQGKLVEHRPEEGTAEDLYRQIQAEKQRLIKEKKIKKDKPLSEITDDEKPFEIPESWKWVRLGSILNKLVDGTHRTPKYTTSGIPFISVKNMSSGVLTFDNTKFISQAEHEELFSRCDPERNDILLSKVGTTGVPAKVETDQPFSLFVSVALLKFDNSLINIDFLVYAIQSPDFQKQCKEHTRGVGNKNWVLNDIANAIFPLPPLAEQKRIVAKIEELLPLIDRYEAAWTKLEAFNKRFPEDMQKSILQQAIEGKLVEQCPEEGTGEDLYKGIQKEKQRLIKECKIKKEKPLPEIAEEEIPFDIPNSWKWIRLNDCIEKNIKRGKAPKYIGKSNVLVFAQKCNTKIGKIDLTLAKFLDESILAKYPDSEFLRDHDIIINGTGNGTLGRVGLFLESDRINNLRIVPDSHVTVVRVNKLVYYKYIYYVLKYLQPYFEKMCSGSTNQTELNPNTIKNVLIGLPPIEEQRRIVEKIEILLPLCEKLK